MKISNKALKRRIVEISYKYRLSHLGSCLTAVDIIYEIYRKKRPEERFILSSAHSSLALYVVLEYNGGKNAEEIFKHHGVHCDRCIECGLDCSGGSLGQGIAISLGMALANRNKKVWCLLSDGEMSEGSVWESLRIAEEQKLVNLKLFLNANGFGAYKKIDVDNLEKKIKGFGFLVNIRKTNNQLNFLEGQKGHYITMTQEQYDKAMQDLQ